MHELETERLSLRTWREGDWEPLHETYGDPEVTRWLGRSPGPKEFTAYAVGRMSMHWEAHGFGMWAVIDRASNEMIGRVGLMFHPKWPVDEHKTEIGWTLRRSAWGRGYATEAGLAARDWAFGNLSIMRLISMTDPENHRSQAVMKRLGLTFRGEADYEGHHNVYYAIDRADWNSIA
jgi:RimJ/RimL family protein N-acetyltransferase